MIQHAGTTLWQGSQSEPHGENTGENCGIVEFRDEMEGCAVEMARDMASIPMDGIGTSVRICGPTAGPDCHDNDSGYGLQRRW